MARTSGEGSFGAQTCCSDVYGFSVNPYSGAREPAGLPELESEELHPACDIMQISVIRIALYITRVSSGMAR